MELMKKICAYQLYQTPEKFYDVAQLMLQEVECALILLMEDRNVPDAELRKLVWDNRLATDPADFIRMCYHRAIINRVMGTDEVAWHIGDFYRRFSFYAQYEFYAYQQLPLETREALNDWQFEEYLKIYGDDVKAKMQGIDTHVHNSDFLTLEEAEAFVDKHADHITLHPCNCKSQYYWRHEKPICVCMGFYHGPNSEADRGHGERITPERAKELLREFNKKGLMQNGEDYAVCNCEGTSCYPLLMAYAEGSRGMYPKSNYHIDWHPDECISCGKCTKICNFKAFQKGEDGKVTYHRDLCWGCTICAPNCPKGAIHLIPKEPKTEN